MKSIVLLHVAIEDILHSSNEINSLIAQHPLHMQMSCVDDTKFTLCPQSFFLYVILRRSDIRLNCAPLSRLTIKHLCCPCTIFNGSLHTSLYVFIVCMNGNK